MPKMFGIDIPDQPQDEFSTLAALAPDAAKQMRAKKDLEKKYTGGPDDPRAATPWDPAYQRDRQTYEANQFRGNIPGMAEEAMQGVREQSRKGLASKIQDIGKSASSRGLLYSGLRAGAEQGAGAQAESDVANKRYDINKNLQDTASNIERGAVSGGLNYRNMMQGFQDQASDAQNKKKQGEGGLLGSAIGAAGGALGGLFK